MKSKNLFWVQTRGQSRILHGGPTFQGTPTYGFDKISKKKRMKPRKLWSIGELGVGWRPLDSPMEFLSPDVLVERGGTKNGEWGDYPYYHSLHSNWFPPLPVKFSSVLPKREHYVSTIIICSWSCNSGGVVFSTHMDRIITQTVGILLAT